MIKTDDLESKIYFQMARPVVYLFIHLLFIKHVYVPNIVLGTKDSTLTEQVYRQTFHGVYVLGVYILFKYVEP